jgi:hypothetical protein
MDGLSGSGSDFRSRGVTVGLGPRRAYTFTGLTMFLTCCSPRSSKA